MCQVLHTPTRLVLSASDLVNHLACEHLSSEQRRVALRLRGRPEARDDPHAELVRRRGDLHEREHLGMLAAAADGDVVEFPYAGHSLEALTEAAELTGAAMRSGAALIYQATLFDGRWQGRTDFLRRVARPSALGDWSYEVLDTKLARSVKPHVVHQLCLYDRLLGELQGEPAGTAYVIRGDGVEERIDLGRFAALHRHVARLLETFADGDPAAGYPEPVAHCGICQLERECDRRRRRDDHLSLVAGASRNRRDRLAAAQISTLYALATAAGTTEVPDLTPQAFDVLHHQAALQLRSRESGLPTRRQLAPEPRRGYALLPPASPGDVYFDLEGDPYTGGEGGLEYLWGWTDAAGAYSSRWAHSPAEEREALAALVEVVRAARSAHPDMHVYHYAPHERSKLRSLAQRYGLLEREIDGWLAEGVLVDLYSVVRQALQVGEESYSLKKLERHHGFVRHETSVREGGGSIVAYEGWLETGESALLEAILAYNREDCASTASLCHWLREQMEPEAAARFGVDFRALTAPEDTPYQGPKWLPDVLALADRLRAQLPQHTGDDDAGQATRRVLAELLLYHYRESKPQYWAWFDLQRQTPLELVDERDAIGMVELDRSVQPVPVARSLDWRYRFPHQETTLEAGDRVIDQATGKGLTLVEVGDDHLVLRRGRSDPAPTPAAIIGSSPPDGKPMRDALVRVAQALLAGEDRDHAARALLGRDPPRLASGTLGPSVEELVGATLGLDRSILPVQGPPGTGKTWRGARMIVAALRAGHRVAVCAFSHAAIHNLLHAVERHARATGFTFRGIYKAGDAPYESPAGLVTGVGDNAKTWQDGYDLVAGTSWLLACDEHRDRFDRLFVDEAGQFALASAVAIAPCAESVVLLGDPQQLPQVNQASHPNGGGASSLEHLLQGEDTVAPGRGVLLDVTWRLHPDVCRFVSERSYDRRLDAEPSCARRSVFASGPISGAGLYALAVEHEGRSTYAPEEAEAIAEACRRLLEDGTFTGEDGATRALAASDIMVVAPYNMAVARIRRAVPAGVRVGTVDMFQGREAPVVFYAMTCSSGEDVPRGIDFLFSRNRMNVAISRAQCIAVLVHSPRLLDADCRTLAQMALVDGACRFVELATPLRV
jgi:predicted RecB family nuclease